MRKHAKTYHRSLEVQIENATKIRARRSRSLLDTKRGKRQDARGEMWDATEWNRWFMHSIRRRGTVSGRQSPRHLSSLFATWRGRFVRGGARTSGARGL